MHIMNDIYLKYEEDVMFHNDVIVIRNIEEDIKYAEEFIQELNGGELSQMVSSGKTVDEVVKDLGGDTAFIRLLSSYKGSYGDGKLSIYCDAENYLTFFCKWIKTILPNMDAEGAYELYAMIGFRRKLDTTNQVKKTRWGSQESIHNKYFSKSKSNFRALFDATEKFKTVDRTIGYLASLEYLLASYICDHGNIYAKDLLDRVGLLYKKRLARDICSMKAKMENNINELHEIMPDRISGHLGGYKTLTGFKKNYPEFSFLGDFNFINDEETLEYIENNYSMSEIVDILIEFHKAKFAKEYPEMADKAEYLVQSDYRYLYELSETGTFLSSDSVVEMEKTFVHLGSSIFKDLVKDEKINRDLLKDILSESTDLDKFCLF